MTTIKNETRNTVRGVVTDSNGRPLANLKIEIYDVDMREWQPLADTVTNKQGKYELQWSHKQLSGRGKKTADIAVKVFTAEKKAELFKSAINEVRFNASEREEINIIIREALPKEVVEFDFLVKEITFLASKVAIADLQENDEHQDISFLSKELEVPTDKIEHLVVAHRLHNISDIDAAFFYALLRKNTLLQNNFTQKFNTRLSIGMGVDEQTLLYDVALVETDRIEADIKTAVNEKLVAPNIGKQVKSYLKILSQYKRTATDYYENEHPQKVINLLTDFFKEDKIGEIQHLFEENKNDLNSFFDKVTDPSFYQSKEKEKKAKTKIEIGKLFGFGNDVIPQIAKARGIKRAEDTRKLAKLNKPDWEKEISKAKPDLKDKKLISTYASALARKMEKEFPTLAFAAQLERAKKPMLKNSDEIVKFFNKHDDFEMTKHNVDLFLKEKKVAKKDKEAIGEELKAVQRIFKLVPNYSKTLALREEKIHSSQHIVTIGKTRFVKEIAPKAGISNSEAKEIYRKAETKHTAAMLVVGDLQDGMSVKDIASFESKGLVKKLEAVSKDFPNLKSLFKGVDTCECKHCRSVYSPAAYLVEILQFLDKRMVVENNAKSILFSRRPELGDIDLGCANANTPVKYIDLVCEILEEAIAPDPGIKYTGKLSDGTDPLKGKISNDLLTTLTAAKLKVTSDALIFETESAASKPHYLRDTGIVCKIENEGGDDYTIYRLRQTFGTAAELDAAPEYVNESAYKKLKNKSLAFQLPFDLSHTEAKAYFNRFDVQRADLMKAFQTATAPEDQSIAAEDLGLTDSERNLISNPPAPNNNSAQQAFWNVPAPADVVDYLKQVDHFLDRTGLSFKELDILLKLKFIDQKKNLYIKHNDLSCDLAQKEIANLDLDALDRIHRFLRLKKKTGWKFESWDEIISQASLGAGTLNDSCLIKAATLHEISEQAKIKLEDLLGFFGELPHLILDEDAPQPLYHSIFLNKAKNGVIDEGLLPEKVDGSQSLSTHIAYISNCLQLKQKDVEFILPLLPDGKLSFSNLSYLFAASSLIKKLKLEAEDFSIIQKLSGSDFTSSPEKVLEFIKTVEYFKDSPLNAPDLRFVLKHEATDLSSREIRDEKIEELLDTLKTGYSEILLEEKSKFDENLSAEEQQEVLINVLSGLEGLTEEEVKTILKFFSKDWSAVTDATGAKSFIDDKLDEGISRTNINAAIDALDALGAGADTSSEQKDLTQALLDSVAAFRIATVKQSLMEQTLSQEFKTDLDLSQTVLKHAQLKKIAPGTDFISDLLLDNFDNAISEANYPTQYDALKLLHKMFALLESFQLNNTSLDWFLRNNADPALGWFELDNIPFKSGQTAVGFDKYISFCRMLSYSHQFSPVINPLDAAQPIDFFTIADMLLLGATASRDEFLYNLSILTGYEKESLDAIDAHLFATADIGHYRNPEHWKKLSACADLARTLGASLDQIIKYIAPTLTAAEVSDLRATLKSRYDEDTWLSTLKEVMDAIRPQKRDALVAYLLATHPEIKDENDLYEYFLVDVQMEACMPSSRIVQAHNSIQLFVQRCLMGLEPEAIADVDKDPNWNQWKWMKNYRVWEANRKVFLYPENWYDVTLTDDKTFLLQEFIEEIQQNELSNDSAEESLKKYLEKLDNIAFLEVMATWYDVPSRNMHVFARTKGGDPSLYYYRRLESERYWSPWEKVDLDITGDHLLAFMRNNRLHLAWPMFSEEAQADQQSKVPSSSDQGDYVDTEQPMKKLKIQLAISEYSNKKWQPKKVSKEAIKTPSGENDYTTDLIPKENIKFFYNQWFDQIIVFNEQRQWIQSGEFNVYYQNVSVISGAFDIAGCKGYPELASPKPFTLNFIPEFRDTSLIEQRYKEMNEISGNDLSAVNVYSLLSGLNSIEILNQTPGNFRLTYPHQFTSIDLIALIFEFLQLVINSGQKKNRDRQFKIPLGTLLPYFKEDSKHAYVIIPGFYKKKKSKRKGTYTLNDSDKRTASNVFQLMDDISNWYKKIKAEFEENPPSDTQEAFTIILTDSDFQNILKELSSYGDLDILLNLLIGVSGDAKVDEFLKDLIQEEPLKYGEQFKNMYHPLVCALRTILYKEGIPELMKRETQLEKTDFNFELHYKPNPQIVPLNFIKNPDGTKTASYPIEDLDFESDGSYSAYNWDLFFRLPLHIATSLTKNQRFEEALTWFHYMFNPTGALAGEGVQKYWVTKPFYLNQEADYISDRIDSLMYETADLSNPNIKELEFAIDEWRKKPFRPDVIARSRPVAYQKALLMKYIDNLTEWGDYLFRQDTMESIAQATQMYVLADKLLGPKPKNVPAVIEQPYETYNQIEAKLDSFGNALIELENILPDFSVLPEGGQELPASPITLATLYFCIPANGKMLEYWDRVADRLFKIRNCQNIEGVERSLALFAPPIDPGMLVRATASGLDISSVIAGLNAPTPYYRFNVLSQKATELAQEVKGLGNSLLQALEKKDAEALALLRNELELNVLNAIKDIKILQIDESIEQIEVLKKTKLVADERRKYYSSIEKIISNEQLNLDKLAESKNWQLAANTTYALGAALALIPDFNLGVSGFGGSPHGAAKFGGSLLAHSTDAIGKGLGIFAALASYEAQSASINAGYDRRFDDWKLQERLAIKELDSIDKQIDVADIRKEIAETDLKNHELQIENAKQTDDFMRSKFTNKELYDWMIGEISAVYFKSYQLAHDFAKKAERCYKFELGNDDSFISYGYWDSMKKGLQSADHLIHDIKRMETSFVDKNKREYEITKHVSLAQLDPLALVTLRASGICDFEIPEVLYDMDHPGQYFRRLKSVSVSIPCIAGPYTSVSAKLSLVNNRYRKNTNPDNLATTGYAEDPGNDERFIYNVGAIQSIATSNAQNDSGVFELNFRDERYLPFEYKGAISSWRLELPTEVKQFDYNSISDVIVHVKYTAREGGSGLKTVANTVLKDQLEIIKQALDQNGLHVALNMKHDMANQWHLLKKNAATDITLDKSRLPYMAQAFDTAVIESVMFIAKVKDNPASFEINISASAADTTLARVDDLQLCKGINTDIELDTLFTLSTSNGDEAKLEELIMVVKYKF